MILILNKIHFLLLTLLFIFAGCSNDDDIPAYKEETSDAEGNISYTIEGMTSEVSGRSIPPSQDETKIQNLVYLLFKGSQPENSTGQEEDKWECVGTIVQPKLNLTGSSGRIEFKFPSDLEHKGSYKVLVIANIGFYTPLTLENFALRIRGNTLGKVRKELLSVGMSDVGIDAGELMKKRNIFAGDDLLMTAEFLYVPGQVIPLLTFTRKNTILNIKYPAAIPKNKPCKLKISNVPLTTGLFNSGYSKTKNKGVFEFEIKPEENGKKIYILPNSPEQGDVLGITITSKTYKEKINVTEIEGATPVVSLALVEGKEVTKEYKLSVGKPEQHSGSYLASNEYINIAFLPSLENRHNTVMTINDWLAGDFNGVYMPSSDRTKGYAISTDMIHFNFADTVALYSALENQIVSGHQSHEIFISSHGVLPSWEIKNDGEIPSWLTLEKARTNTSVVVTAEPNFQITPDGNIVSVPRKYEFKIQIGDREFKVRIRQDAAPLYPTDIELPSGITVRDRSYGATSNRFYNNINYYAPKRFVGDHNSKGYYFNHTTAIWYEGDGGKHSVKGHDYPTTEKNEFIWLEKRVCGEGYSLPTMYELAEKVYPYLRQYNMNVDGVSTSVYYLATKDRICFIPLLGNYLGVDYSQGGGIVGTVAESFKYSALTGWYGYDPDRKGIDTEGAHSQSNKVWVYAGIKIGPINNSISDIGVRFANNEYMNHSFRCIKRKAEPINQK